jgi:hypothetical protein
MPGLRFVVCLLVLALPGCALKRVGFDRMADALSATAGAYAADNDPEFVRAGAPSTLKMVEMLLDQEPRHPGLLLTACRGFTQYAYAFLQVDAELQEATNAAAARETMARAALMYDRARAYCLRALDAAHPGLGDSLSSGDLAALTVAGKPDVAALYWTGASWGGSISAAPAPLLRVVELAAVKRILRRALELDPAWDRGAIHEALIGLEGLPALAGGSAQRAKVHFDQAVALSNGRSAFAYVMAATSVAQPAGDRAGFERLLKEALAIDVNRERELRLANLIAQKRARFLLTRAPQLF